VVDACRNYEQVILLDLDTDPSLVVAVYLVDQYLGQTTKWSTSDKLTSHVKVSGSIVDITDLLVLVEMLLKKALHFGLVGVTETSLADSNLVPDRVCLSGPVPTQSVAVTCGAHRFLYERSAAISLTLARSTPGKARTPRRLSSSTDTG
jgi:hypothetical protein